MIPLGQVHGEHRDTGSLTECEAEREYSKHHGVLLARVNLDTALYPTQRVVAEWTTMKCLRTAASLTGGTVAWRDPVRSGTGHEIMAGLGHASLDLDNPLQLAMRTPCGLCGLSFSVFQVC
ncbi:hypothetical protein RRG08_026610 [Elysia crispata]|uniref:Uncharacterized protein n=1 Tax=Elysia crispata TaxID=231223 RepID=A0AAE1E733_9GAST|nr:hypothetical protein RRG08_026610 [Elysia crispata]